METIQAILEHRVEIPGLPSDKLVTIDTDGDLLPYPQENRLTLQILRLQTLILREIETTAVGLEVIRQEGSNRLFFLQWHIIELVRQQYGMECDHFGVGYLVNSSGQLIRIQGRVDFVERDTKQK